MAIKKVWPITFSCGHSEERDLSDKKADKRAGFARWLADTQCTVCWRASKDGADGKSKAEFTKAKRAEEHAEIEAWEKDSNMAPLSGSEKATDWGRRVRYETLAGAYTALVEGGDMADDQFEAAIEEPARRIDSASWWIDNRDTDAGDLQELIEAAQETAAVTNENPYG